MRATKSRRRGRGVRPISRSAPCPQPGQQRRWAAGSAGGSATVAGTASSRRIKANFWARWQFPDNVILLTTLETNRDAGIEIRGKTLRGVKLPASHA